MASKETARFAKIHSTSCFERKPGWPRLVTSSVISSGENPRRPGSGRSAVTLVMVHVRPDEGDVKACSRPLVTQMDAD